MEIQNCNFNVYSNTKALFQKNFKWKKSRNFFSFNLYLLYLSAYLIPAGIPMLLDGRLALFRMSVRGEGLCVAQPACSPRCRHVHLLPTSPVLYAFHANLRQLLHSLLSLPKHLIAASTIPQPVRLPFFLEYTC